MILEEFLPRGDSKIKATKIASWHVVMVTVDGKKIGLDTHNLSVGACELVDELIVEQGYPVDW